MMSVSKGECQTLTSSELVTPGELDRDGGDSALCLDGLSILKQDTSQWLEYPGQAQSIKR